MKRVAKLASLCTLIVAMASAQRDTVEAEVVPKKDKLLKYNPYAKNRPELLMDKVFCLCMSCSVMPIMARNDMTNRSTAYRHSQVDVKNGHITQAELRAAVGTKTFIGYEDYFRLFRDFKRGKLDVDGNSTGH